MFCKVRHFTYCLLRLLTKFIIDMELSQKIKSIPRKPGVYLFHDESGKVLYVGKAKVLRSRVRSYFRKSSLSIPRIQNMVKKISDIEWLVTRSESEALLTEAAMIKEHEPRYNILMRDDKSYPYVRITNEPFPQVLLTRKIVNDGSRYFGPFTEVYNLRETLKVIHKIFPVRSCSYLINDDIIARKKISVCLDYHIRKCLGPCEGLQSQEDYSAMIEEVVRFLHGRTDKIVKQLRNEMVEASKRQDYEEAALCRDRISAVEAFTKRQRKISASFADQDIIAVAVQQKDACAAVIRLRNGRIIGRERMFLSGVHEQNMSEILSGFMKQFYLESDFLPQEILLQEKPEGCDSLAEWLSEKRGKKVTITAPQRGEKAKLVRLSLQNAELLLAENIRKRERRRELVPEMIQQLQADLNLEVPPRRIEAFDISNIQGSNPVGSMVCFVDGVAKKREYRKFKIKTVKGIDDFAMIREVVLRRYSRLKSEKATFPDLILIDGGKGQLSMAVSALQELGLSYISVIGLAKRLEEVYVPGSSDPQNIPKSSPGLFLLRRIRDEAHRFAVTFHRLRRKKAATESIFDGISGIGPARRKNLLTKFENVKSISDASVEKVAEEVGVGEKLAEEIISVAKEFVNRSK
ncbi:MAG TPA: excinuclease ABC subunit C [Candidatus Marinimicrobia bacterium]|nr:excinuclease ABC subunit C [Candidatus Neomarinimicrobiota bacterium]